MPRLQREACGRAPLREWRDTARVLAHFWDEDVFWNLEIKSWRCQTFTPANTAVYRKTKQPSQVNQVIVPINTAEFRYGFADGHAKKESVY